MRAFIRAVAFGTLMAGCSMMASAQWSTNPNVNNAICTAGGQFYPAGVGDGSGGAIITWEDRRTGFADIYSQRINASGVVQWTVDGVAICNSFNGQDTPKIVSDGAGGAIITWNDRRNGNSNNDVYAQRINGSGVAQWTPNGVAISNATSDQVAPTIVGDGAGGAIITWEDTRSDTLDIYAQRINASGVVQWTADGVEICTAASAQQSPKITSDGAVGAIITWQDFRGGGFPQIYAQRINASGSVQWTTNGVAITTGDYTRDYPTIVSDGAGGAIITWQDGRSGSFDIYAQRINASGGVQWTANGVVISAAGGNQYFPTVVSDGVGGGIIAWEDRRSVFAYDIYAQRINASGLVQWTANGVAISTAPADERSPTVVSDGVGGAIIAWQDSRPTGTSNDIYAQRINASGAVQWATNGVAISTAANNQDEPTIVIDGARGAIISWYDSRSGANIYAQQVSANGLLGVVTDVRHDIGALPESFRLEQNYPNPFNPSTTIRYAVPQTSFVTLAVYNSLGQQLAQLVNEQQQAGYHDVTFRGDGLASGVYFYRIQAGDFVAGKKLILLK